MRKTMLRLVCAVGAPLLVAANAGAADYYDDPYPPAAVYVAPPVYAPAPSYGRVFYYQPPVATYDPRPRIWPSHPPTAFYNYVEQPTEWVPVRPRSCGKYRYWDGEYCADARFQRPYVGPRW